MSKVFKGLDDILFAQILQDRVDFIVLNVVTANPKFDDSEMLKRMRLLLGGQMVIKLFLVLEGKITRPVPEK